MTTISSLCVFCGSKTGGDARYAEAARRLGRQMAGRGVRLVYGAGSIGLMGVVADAVADGGGEITGVIPEFLEALEVGRRDVTEFVVTESMHARKNRMFELADGFVTLPGGLGTFDETIEIITWKQLRLHAKPVIIVDVGGYWGAFSAMIDNAVEHGFAHPGVRDLYTVVDGVDAVWPALERAPEPAQEVLTSHL